MIDPQRTIERAEDRIMADRNKKEIINTLSGIVINELKPALQELSNETRNAVKDYLEGIKGIKIEAPKVDVNVPDVVVPKIELPNINVPEANVKVSIPEIKIPEIKTDKIEKAIEKAMAKIKIPKPEISVNMPDVKIPKIEIPKIEIPKQVVEEVSLKGINQATPLPVILTTDKGEFYKAMMSVSGGGGGRRVEVIKPETVDILNVTMTDINTEYSQALPKDTVAMTFQCRTAFDVRFSYHTGFVATPIAPYMTLKAGMIYYETNLKLTDKTLYLACGTAGKVVEIIAYH